MNTMLNHGHIEDEKECPKCFEPMEMRDTGYSYHFDCINEDCYERRTHKRVYYTHAFQAVMQVKHLIGDTEATRLAQEYKDGCLND